LGIVVLVLYDGPIAWAACGFQHRVLTKYVEQGIDIDTMAEDVVEAYRTFDEDGMKPYDMLSEKVYPALRKDFLARMEVCS
jgi:hypothetical protein